MLPGPGLKLKPVCADNQSKGAGAAVAALDTTSRNLEATYSFSGGI
jgi:hypothetical protein